MIVIPLQGGAINAHQSFSIQLGDNFLEFKLNYMTRFDKWILDISKEGEKIICGAAIVSNAEITKFFNADIGRIFVVGDEVTLDNLGKSNFMVWVDA